VQKIGEKAGWVFQEVWPQRPQNECTHGRARSRPSTGTAPVHTRGCSQNQFFLDALNPYERSFQSAARRFATQLRIGTR
jgi:hypothetical protein